MFDYIIIIFGIIWLIAASISDIKTKEVPNWLNFSLLSIAFGILSFKSLVLWSFSPILNGLLGFGIFFLVGNLMYYTKQWGGGDAKLLYGLGALFYEYPTNLETIFHPNLSLPFLAILFLNIIILGSIYGILISISLMITKRKLFLKKFKELNSKTKGVSKILSILLVLLIIATLFITKETSLKFIFILSGIFPIVLFYLFIAVKSIEEVCMYKKIKTSKLVEGDWVAETIKVNKKVVYNHKKSLGVTKDQIKIIKKYKEEVLIKEGIAFVPPFLIATIVSLLFGNFLF